MKKLMIMGALGFFYSCVGPNGNNDYENVGVSPSVIVQETSLLPDSIYGDWDIYVLSNYFICNESSSSVKIEISFLIDRPLGGDIKTFNVTYDQADKLILFNIKKSDSGGNSSPSLDRYDFSFSYSGVQSNNVHYFGFKYDNDSKRKKVVSADPDNHPILCN